jgi:GT2 family glycosyltransferase
MNSQEFQNNELKTSVLFLVFNRPDTTSKVFEAIRQAKPPRLYVAADGPREDKLGEVERVKEARTIATAVDWPCEVKTLFRDKNLGCKEGVSSAINWFFEQEEQGIILEDDCLPSLSFFKFCEIMLDKYRENKSVWMINGFNPHHPGISSSEYFMSQNPSVWGWASWRDRWVHYTVDIDYARKEPYWSTGLKLPDYVISYYDKAFSDTASEKIDTWDYQLSFLILKNNGYVIKSFANLVSNIGVYGKHSN